jgi:hypothetical protein
LSRRDLFLNKKFKRQSERKSVVAVFLSLSGIADTPSPTENLFDSVDPFHLSLSGAVDSLLEIYHIFYLYSL